MSPASPDSRAWPAHHRIGAFELVVALRESDTGILYRAWDHALARPVLLEEFLPAALAQRGPDDLMVPALPAAAAMLERAGRLFIDESRVLARAEHPALARVLHLVEAHGTAFRVMPGYAGTPLADLLARGEAPRDEDTLRRLLDDTLGALEAWHVVAGPHGGVRPTRLWWLEGGRALLFGPDAAGQTALGATPPTEGGLLAGAQAPGAAEGQAADLHALAQVLRACLLGTAPVDPALPLPAAVDAAVQHARAHGLSAPPACSDTLLQALDAALSPDLLRRPVHAGQFRQWLQRGPAGAPRPVPAAAPVPTPVPPPVPTPPRATPRADATPSDDEDVDAATSALIRSLVDAIPDRTPPAARNTAQPRKPTRDETAPGLPPDAGADIRDDPIERIEPDRAHDRLSRADPAHAPPHARPTARTRQRLIGASVALAVLVVVALAGRQTLWPVPKPPPIALAPAPVPMPAPAPVTAPVPAPAPNITPSGSTEPGVAGSGTATPPSNTPPPAAEPEAPPQQQQPQPQPAPREFVEPPREEPRTAPREQPAPRRTAPRPTPRPEPQQVVISPRQQCGDRSEFALYRCMQQQCGQNRWRGHPQCTLLRQTDRVPG